MTDSLKQQTCWGWLNFWEVVLWFYFPTGLFLFCPIGQTFMGNPHVQMNAVGCHDDLGTTSPATTVPSLSSGHWHMLFSCLEYPSLLICFWAPSRLTWALLSPDSLSLPGTQFSRRPLLLGTPGFHLWPLETFLLELSIRGTVASPGELTASFVLTAKVTECSHSPVHIGCQELTAQESYTFLYHK